MSKKHIDQRGLAVLLVLISTLGFSVYPILGKLVFAGGASLATVLFVRFTIAAVVFWAITLWQEGFPRLSLKTWLVLWGMGGICYSMMAGLYISSVLFIPASLAALLLYAYPAIVAFLAVLTKQEGFSIFKFTGLVLSTLGLVLVLGLALQGINIIGVGLALGAAFVYGVYIIVGNKMLETVTPLVSSAVISTSAAVTYGTIGLPVGGATWHLAWQTWLGIAGIAFFSTIIAMLTFFQGIKWIGATTASIISTTEPVMTVIFAVLLFHEQLTFIQGIGGIFVVIGGILAVISPSKITHRLSTPAN